MAIFLKQSLERKEQLHRITMSVSEGQIIIDPALTNLMFAEKEETLLLKEFTARELEILDLIARGYTNSAIAQNLFIDVKTVHNHINSIYSKFKADTDLNQRHPRVSVTRLYLETKGELVPAAC